MQLSLFIPFIKWHCVPFSCMVSGFCILFMILLEDRPHPAHREHPRSSWDGQGCCGKKKTCKMSLLYMKTKLPECISLNVLLAFLANYLCHSRYIRPSFLAQKKLKKDPTHVADSILIFYCSQYIFRAYLVYSNQWHIYSSSSYLTYFSLCSIFSLYKAHVSWQKKWIV